MKRRIIKYKTLVLDSYKNVTEKFFLSRRKQISFYKFSDTLYKELKQNDIISEAQAIAFSFTLSLFPGIIFLFTLVPFIPIEGLDAKILIFLQNNIPANYYIEAKETIENIVEEMIVRQRGDLLSFGFVFAMIAATNGMMVLINSFNKIYHTREKRGFIKTRLTAILLTFIFVFVLFTAIFLIIFSEGIANFLDRYQIVHTIFIETINALNSLLLVLIFFIMTSMIYYIAPSVHKKWKFFSLGAIVATIMFGLSSYAFAYYISNFSSYNKLYGSIGTLIGVMLWIQIVAYVILLGFEINVAIDRCKEELSKK